MITDEKTGRKESKINYDWVGLQYTKLRHAKWPKKESTKSDGEEYKSRHHKT